MLAITIAGMAGCEETPPMQYNLILTVEAPGTGTAVDVTDSSPYAAGTVVSIRAEAAPGHRFAGWTAPAGVFADADAAETTFTMPAQNVTVTAGFFAGQLIQSWHDLDAVREDLAGSYLLMNDLDSTAAGYAELAGPAANGGKGWQPLGTSAAKFTGTFDGKGHQIRDLVMNRPNEDGIGLFGITQEDGVIENVAIMNVVVIGHDYVGGLVGDNWGGNITNCYSTGSITGNNFVGGLVGITGGTINNSYSASSMEGTWWVGGLAGCNEGTIMGSYATGSASGYQGIGGLVGDNYQGTVNGCYSTGGVIGESWVGGLIGANLGTVTNSFWDMGSSGTEESAGGTGKTSSQMKDIATFTDTVTEGLDAPWNMGTVGDASQRNPAYTWNIVSAATYPFLSWQPVS